MTETWKGFTAAYLDETFLPGYLTPEEYFYFTGRLNRLSKARVDETLATMSTFLILVDMLRQLSADSRNAILVSSHDINHITGLCHRILLMERGAIIKDIDTTADTLQELADYFRTKLPASPATASSQQGMR